MGEIDTKPIESVQTAVSLFGEKFGHLKSRSTSPDPEVKEKEKDVGCLLQEVANYKVQLEAKDAAYKQALLKLDHYEKTMDGLSTLLKNAELDRDIHIEECREARAHISMLELKMEETAKRLVENEGAREQLSQVLAEYESTQEQLLRTKAKVEALEKDLNMEKGKMEELLSRVTELDETVLHFKAAESERCGVLSEKEAELELANEKLVEAEDELRYLREKLELVQDLENQLLSKSTFIGSLQLELRRVNELLSSAEVAATEAINEMNRTKEEFEAKERESSDRANYISLLEMELSKVMGKLEKARSEVEEISKRENEAQVEVALLKSEVHRERSKVAAAEAAEARAEGERSTLYAALEQMALEVEQAKRDVEMRLIPSGPNLSEEEVSQFYDSKSEAEEIEASNKVMITLEVYEGLVTKAENAERAIIPVPENTLELETLRRELENATARVGEFRTRAEQAASRAEVAEQARAALEEQIRRSKEQKERRQAALAALQEERNYTKKSCSPNVEGAPKSYQPLSVFLKNKI